MIQVFERLIDFLFYQLQIVTIEQHAQDIFFQKCKRKITLARSMDKSFFNYPVKNDMRKDKIWKIATDQKNDNTSGCLLDYPYFKELSKL